MICKCGHEQDKHEQLNGGMACMVRISDTDYVEYCPCMDFVQDENDKLAALLAAGDAMADELRSCQYSFGILDKRTAALAAWESVTK